MRKNDSTEPASHDDAQLALLPVDTMARLHIAEHAARSRAALTDFQRRTLIRRIEARRVRTGWVR